MRGGPDRWLSGRVWDDDPAPRRARSYDHDDPNVTLVHGHHSRREASIAVPDNTITLAEQRVLGERAREAAEARRADMDRALLGVVRLGAALRAQEG